MHVVTDHIPGPDMRPHLTEEETERILRSLEQITPYLPAPEYLALENLERHPTDYLDGWSPPRNIPAASTSAMSGRKG